MYASQYVNILLATEKMMPIFPLSVVRMNICYEYA